MRINDTDKQMEMEARDINYILPAYVRSYLFYSKNEMPERIIFPMFSSVMVGSVEIPIEYVPPIDPVAVEIAQDGKDVPEVTPVQEAALDEKDEEINRLKTEISSLQSKSVDSPLKAIDEDETEEQTAARLEEEVGGKPEPVSKARAAFTVDGNPKHQPPPDRKPNQPPGGDIGPGLGPSDMHARDRRDQARTKKDLAEEPDINEAEEKEFEKTVSRDKQGKPVVEESDDKEAS